MLCKTGGWQDLYNLQIKTNNTFFFPVYAFYDRQTDRHRLTDRKKDRKTDREIGRQDIHTDRHSQAHRSRTERQTDITRSYRGYAYRCYVVVGLCCLHRMDCKYLSTDVHIFHNLPWLFLLCIPWIQHILYKKAMFNGYVNLQ